MAQHLLGAAESKGSFWSPQGVMQGIFSRLPLAGCLSWLWEIAYRTSLGWKVISSMHYFCAVTL